MSGCVACFTSEWRVKGRRENARREQLNQRLNDSSRRLSPKRLHHQSTHVRAKIAYDFRYVYLLGRFVTAAVIFRIEVLLAAPAIHKRCEQLQCNFHLLLFFFKYFVIAISSFKIKEIRGANETSTLVFVLTLERPLIVSMRSKPKLSAAFLI